MALQNGVRSVDVSVRNLGGIETEELRLDRGVTLLTGRNATNRTSLLRSIAAGLGGSDGQLKSDADAGEVRLAFDGTEYTRRFERIDEGVRTEGEPYTTGAALVDLFSSLLESNRARRAVERADGAALREVVMEPVDTAEIRAEVERHRRQIRSLEEEREGIESALDRLPSLERRLNERRDELADVRSELAECRETVERFEADADAVEAAEGVVEELKETRSEFETVRNRLETQRNALASIREERGDLAADLEATSEPGAQLDEATTELERLQRRERELESTINSLLSIVQFNEELLAGDADGFAGDADGFAGDGVVEELDPSTKTVTCWTCGTAVERTAIDERLADLRSVIEDKRAERNELGSEIEGRRETVRTLRERECERSELESELAEIGDEIETRERRVETLSERKAALREEIEELEAEAAESERLRDSDLLAEYERLSELEYERGQLEESLDSLEDEIESIEARREERDRVEAELEERREALASLRDRIEELERAAVETFNEHVETLLARLEYENLERVWIERKPGDAGTAQEGTFDLHIVRSDDGTVYEDGVEHLSESEREVIGLVVALAGYLVHDVHETVPMMLLDSLEAIDSERIAALVEYFADYAPFLIVALLPEDARALPDRYDRVAMGGAVA